MELRQLRTFVTVAETLNISEAARRMRVTQPALSRHIRSLEHTVGQPLFVRAPGRLRLTATGLTLRDQGEKALAAFDEALRSARATVADEEATLRIGYYGSVSIWSSLLAPALEKLGRKYPRATSSVVELTCPQLAHDVSEGRLDLAILGPGDYARFPGAKIEVACTVRGLAMLPANHRLAKKRQIALEDLRGEEIVGVTDEVAPGRECALIEACQAAGFSPRVASVATSLPGLIMEVTKRNGIAVLGSLATLVPHPGVVFVPFKPPGVPLNLYLARSVHLSAAAQYLAELVAAQAQRVALAG